MPNSKLADVILEIITKYNRRFQITKAYSNNKAVEGTIFEGISETDLMHALRDRRYRLPRGWLSEVESLGFTVRQVYRIGEEVRTYFDEPAGVNPETGERWAYDAFQRRKLPRFMTIISL